MSEAASSIRKVLELTESVTEAARQAALAGIIAFTPAGDFLSDLVRGIVDRFMETPLISDPYAATVPQDKLRETIKHVLATGALLTLFGEDLSEIATESFSDGLSNALYAGALGAIDMMMRLHIGAIPPQSPFTTDMVDEEWQAFLDAASGTHFHALALGHLDRYLRGLREDILSDPVARGIIDSYVAAHYPELIVVSEFANMFRETVRRMVESVAAILEALFARAEDAVLEWRAAKFLYEQGVIGADKYGEAEARAHAELDAVEAELDAIEEDLEQFLSDWLPAVPQSIVDAYTRLKQGIIDRVNADVPGLRAYIAKLADLRDRGKPSNIGYRVHVAGQDIDVREV